MIRFSLFVASVLLALRGPADGRSCAALLAVVLGLGLVWRGWRS